MIALFDLKRVYYPEVSAKIGWDLETQEFILQVDAKMSDDTVIYSFWRTKHLRNIVTICEHQYAIVDKETLEKVLVEANGDDGQS